MVELGSLELDQLGRAKVEQKIFAKFNTSHVDNSLDIDFGKYIPWHIK